MDYEMERREALQAGEQALLALREARKQLDGAKGWGLWDLLGGGTFASLIKQSKIMRAKSSVQEAKYRLQTFSKELRDISVDLNIDIGDFLTFFDLWDNFLADIIVQSRMRDACHKIDEAIYKVENVLSRIR